MASGFKLPADEFAVRRKSFELLHSALPKLIEQYNALPDSHFGKYINIDLA